MSLAAELEAETQLHGVHKQKRPGRQYDDGLGGGGCGIAHKMTGQTVCLLEHYTSGRKVMGMVPLVAAGTD